MENKKTLLILVLAFVVLLVGASALYAQLIRGQDNDNLAILDPNAGTDTDASQDAADGENAAEDAATDKDDATEGDATKDAAADGGESASDDTQQDDEPDGDSEEEQATMAPDFTVYDAEGNAAKLSDYFGKPIVLNFWASWCGPCKMEMPEFQEKCLEYEGEVIFLMVNMTGGRETLTSAKRFIEESGYTFPVLYDTKEDAAMTYAVYSLPTTYFLNAEGQLIARATGAIDATLLQRGIDMIR